MIFRMNPDTLDTKPIAAPAHMHWRLLALVYDAVIAIALLMALSALVLFLRDGKAVTPGSMMAFAEFTLLWALIGAYAVLSWRFGGQTIGMRPWRLRVVDTEGGVPGWRSLGIRYAVASLSLGSVLLWCLFDKQNRGLHDLAAGTLMVRVRPKSA
jgi:uncharacterized RDD family membrane protein YckC